MKKTLGIIGGMGPLATCDLMRKVIEHTDANCDQEHVHIVVDCNTNIPDRTGAILSGGADPVPEMTKSAVGLEKMGADVLIVPCNTAHYFLPRVSAGFTIPILSMPEETAKYLRECGIKKAAILATDGTVRTGIYEKGMRDNGVEFLYPDQQEQSLVMSLIYDCVKAGKPCTQKEQVMDMCRRMMAEGAETFVLACTELPIAFAEMALPVPTADPTDILACAAVRWVGCKVK